MLEISQLPPMPQTPLVGGLAISEASSEDEEEGSPKKKRPRPVATFSTAEEDLQDVIT